MTIYLYPDGAKFDFDSGIPTATARYQNFILNYKAFKIDFMACYLPGILSGIFLCLLLIQ